TFMCFFSSRRRHTRSKRDWSSDVCSSDLLGFMSADELEEYIEQDLNPKAEEWLMDQIGDEIGGFGGAFDEEGSDDDLSEDGDKEIGRASCRERGQNREKAIKMRKRSKGRT